MRRLFFVLIVSSCNRERWSSAEQQESWGHEGNLVFIDPVPEDEMKAMLAKAQKVSKQDLMENFHYVGGVPRLCLQSATSARSIVDAAFSELDFTRSAKSISKLSDPMKLAEGAGNLKVYPGLLVHTVPTNAYRNQFYLRLSSDYVYNEVVKIVNLQDKSSVRRLLSELLNIPSARGLLSFFKENKRQAREPFCCRVQATMEQ